jgi:hypothetical protein
METTETRPGRRRIPPPRRIEWTEGVLRYAAPMLKVAAGALLASQAGAADWTFEPRVSLGQTWTDNVNLEPEDAEESEWITELKPGFSLALENPRAQAQLDYDLQALWFDESSELDDVFHQGRGTGNFVLAPDNVFLDVFGRYEQQTIDPAGRMALNNFFNTENRTDTLVLVVSPYHFGRWGSWGESLVRYQYQDVRYLNTDETAINLRDSDTHAVHAALGSPQARRGFSWRASGSRETTDFEVSAGFKYSRAALELGMPIGLRSRLTATGGRESDVAADPTKGGLDSTYWYVGYAWEPSELESLEARVGDRYFGTAWELRWIRRGSQGELSLDYNEEPTTSAGVLGDSSMFEPGYRPIGIARLDTRVFLRKRLSARASYRFVRSTLAARLYSDRREYEDSLDGTEKYHGAAVSFDWDLATRTRLGSTVDWSQRQFGSDAGTDDHVELSLRLTRELTRLMSAVLRGSHFRRDSDDRFDYQANQVSLTVLAQF